MTDKKALNDEQVKDVTGGKSVKDVEFTIRIVELKAEDAKKEMAEGKPGARAAVADAQVVTASIETVKY